LKCGLVILVNGNSTPEKHPTNFKLAVKYYQKLTGARFLGLSGKWKTATCMVSLDEDIYIAVGGKSFTELLG